MPHGGDLVLELVKDDPWDPHCAILPSNGDKQWVWLPICSRGTATLNLDGQAFDPSTGHEVWRWRSETPMVASVLATGGDLVFVGQPSGEFNAFHARTGELLWQFQTGSGHHSSPTTYSVDGRQYVAVPVGWGGWVEGFAPEMAGAPRGTALFAFALPD